MPDCLCTTLGMMKNNYLRRAVCTQMNMADSERMAGCLDAAGYECAEDPSEADVLIYNTCSIRKFTDTSQEVPHRYLPPDLWPGCSSQPF